MTRAAPQKREHIVKRRLFWSFGSQTFAIGLRILQQLALVPILIGGWGANAYADWIVVFSAASLLSFLDFGIQIYYGNALLIARSQLDDASYRRYFGVAMGFYILIMLIATAVFVGATFLISWPLVLNTQTLSSLDTSLVFAILAATVLILIPFGIVTAVYRAHGDYARGGFISAVAEAIRGLSICAVVLLGGGMVLASGVYLIIAVLFWIGVVIDQRRRYGALPFSIAIPTRSEFKEGAVGAGLYLAPTIMTPVILNGPILLLGMLAAAPGAVIAFSVSRTFTGFVRQVVHQICHPVGAELSRHQAAGDGQRVRRIFNAAGRLVSGLAGLFSGLAFVVAAPFLHIWTNGTVEYDPWLVGLFLVAIVLSAPSQVAFLMFQYNNQPKVLAISCTVQTLVTIVLCVLLLDKFSAVGAAASLAIAELLTVGFLISIVVLGSTRLPLLPYLVRCYSTAIASFALGYFAALILTRVADVGSLLSLSVLGVGWTAVVAIPAFFLMIAARERDWLYQFVQQRLN